MRVMIIGASRHRNKYGNKAVRAYQQQGHDVLPVNPHAEAIEGIAVHASIADVPEPIDRAALYLPEQQGLEAVEALAARGDVGEVYLNPGADAPNVVRKAEALGLNVRTACAIVAIGLSPSQFQE